MGFVLGFDFDGYVLRPPRSASANASTTDAATNGVAQDVRELPSPAFTTPSPPVVDVRGDQYRTAVLRGPGGAFEYLIWAANDSNLAIVADPSWTLTEGGGSIPLGALIVGEDTGEQGTGASTSFGFTSSLAPLIPGTVQVQALIGAVALTMTDDGLGNLSGAAGSGTVNYLTGLFAVTFSGPPDASTSILVLLSQQLVDGTDRAVITDNGGRSLSEVQQITITRGDTGDEVEAGPGSTEDFAYQDADGGVIVLSAATLAVLDGGLSVSRGDRISEVQYLIAPAKFWWTRNDTSAARFGWNGRLQRWEPFRGGTPSDLGLLLQGENYSLSPAPSGASEGTYLPGSSTVSDSYSMVRLGVIPDATSSVPVAESGVNPFSGILVVSNKIAGTPFDFTLFTPPPAAVVGVGDGTLQWNPDFIVANAGQRIWYSFREFSSALDGQVGDLRGSDDASDPRFIAPIPGPTDRPFIKLGQRRPLLPLLMDTDALLASLIVASGEVGISLSTGKLKFNSLDATKADPGLNTSPNPNFDVRFLGAVVQYGGVALNQKPQPVRSPVALVSSGGDLFVPDSVPAPDLGVSGIRHVPDKTGAIPTTGVPALRPGPTGLLRKVEGVGDTILFSRNGVITTIRQVGLASSLPKFAFKVPKGVAYIAREDSGAGSKVKLSQQDLNLFGSDPIYFLQADFDPAVYASTARIYSRNRGPFTFDGSEQLHFSIDGASATWLASSLGSGTHTAAEVATSINLTVPGASFDQGGKVVLQAGTPTGSVEIGFGVTKDLSGAAVLGLLPGWRVDDVTSNDNWLPDSGISLGLFRSPVNLDRTKETSDFRSRSRVEDEILTESVQPQPFVRLDQVPLEDVAGYDDHLFFKFSNGLFHRFLGNYDEVKYDFGFRRFAWMGQSTTSQAVFQPTTTLSLGQSNVIPETLFSGVNQGGLSVSEPGAPLSDKDLGVDYLLPLSGAPGTAVLISQSGVVSSAGSRGTFSAGSTLFADSDPGIDFSSAAEGYRLKILSGEAMGSYLVGSTTSSTLTVHPAFPASSGSDPVSWQIFTGLPDSVFDPSLLADVVYQTFDHLPEDPFKVRVLSLSGFVDNGGSGPGVTPPGFPFPGSTLAAVMEPALTRGRVIRVRFGVDPGPEADLVRLAQGNLGTIANGILFVPDSLPASDRFTDGAFSIRLGTTNFTPTGVADFASPIPAGSIEYQTTGSADPGLLRFASDLLSDFEITDVIYVEEFRAAPLLDVRSSGTLTLVASLEVGDTATIDGEVFTAVEAPLPNEPPLPNDQFALGASTTLTAISLAAAINDLPSLSGIVTAIPVGAGVALISVQFGTVGNTLTLSSNPPTRIRSSGRTLSGAFAEIRDSDGEISLSASDLSRYTDELVYFVEEMITEEGADVVLSPLNGGFRFNESLREGQVVEVEYFQADSSGQKSLDKDGNSVRIVEFLSLFVRGEPASLVAAPRLYSFNPTSRTTAPQIKADVYVGVELKTYGNEPLASANFETDEIHLLEDASATAVVSISYAVLEAFGGEFAYTASTVPVYRPPFFLLQGQDTFGLETDRTSDMEPGRAFRLGAVTFYIKSSAYDATTDLTTVTIFPPPSTEVGSRAPSNDVVRLLTSIPVTASVDPNAPVAIPDAPVGYMLPVTTPYNPVSKEASVITFQGDLSQFSIPGHLMEIGGYPFTITGSEVAEDGLTTQVALATPTKRSFRFGTHPVTLSVRPAYPPQARVILGTGPVLQDLPFELVLFGEKDLDGLELPGRTLVFSLGYDLSFDTGNVTLLEPYQAPLGPGQSLVLYHTRQEILGPVLSGGEVLLPRYRAKFGFITIPSTDNRLLGRTLKATYSFENPDSFFFRAVPLLDYLGEVADAATNQAQAATAPVFTGGPTQENHEFGVVGLDSLRRDILDQDRAARTYIDFYNQVVLAFEQILETASGNVIGDRVGKFRFFVGKGKEFPSGGDEDEISGELAPRNTFTELFLSKTVNNAGGPVRFLESDNIVVPSTASVSGGVLRGAVPSPDLFQELLVGQVTLIQNDMDDRLLISLKRPKVTVSGTFTFNMEVKGNFRVMMEPNPFSRLFPESVKAFFRTLPGAGADLDVGNFGAYTFGRTVVENGEPARRSTYRRAIGNLSNPVLGEIGNISSASIFPRLARARVIAYSETGFPGFEPASAGRPSIIASIVPVSKFPIDPNTGFPDVSQLMSQGGDIPDLDTGDPGLSTPNFRSSDPATGPALDQIAFGRPDGTLFDVGYTGGVLNIGGQERLPGLYVHEVLQGCVITLRTESDLNGAPPFGIGISSPGQIAILSGGSFTGVPLELNAGDTIFVTTPTGSSTPVEDPPSAADIKRLSASLPTFRIGFDLGLRDTTGELVDLTMPSEDDPTFFAIKEWVGQRPPAPFSTLESQVRIRNGETEPLQFPALLGEATDDDGDTQIPYLSTTNTELDRLGVAAATMTTFALTDNFSLTSGVYPDEILAGDGSIVTEPSPSPAALLTSGNLTPVFVPGSGTGTLQPYDLVLVERGQAGVPPSSQGILSVGKLVGSGQIEPPRFATQSRLGDPIRYTFDNCMVSLVGDGVEGMTVEEDGVNTVLTLTGASTTSGYDLSGFLGVLGAPGPAYPNGNILRVRVAVPGSAVFQDIAFVAGSVTGDVATVGTALPSFTATKITIPAVGFFDFTAHGGPPGPTGVLDFSVSVDTFGAGSTTALVQSDRLTFQTDFDLRNIGDRSATTTGGIPMVGALDVLRVTGPYSTSISVNSTSNAEINGGDPFTFVRRSGEIGTWAGLVGTARVPAFEGRGNLPITSTAPVTFSAMPSSSESSSGVILVGTGLCDGKPGLDNRIISVGVTGGSVLNVGPGDLLVIESASDGSGPAFGGALATTKAGSYVVKHAIEETAPGHRQVALSAEMGLSALSSQWAPVVFSTVTSFSALSNRLNVTSLESVSGSVTGHGFPSAGRVYVVLDADAGVVVSASYSSVGLTSFLTMSGYEDESGNPISAAQFGAKISTGQSVSGMVFIPVKIGGVPGLPPTNVVGVTGAFPSVAGYSTVTLTGISGGKVWNASASEIVDPPGDGISFLPPPSDDKLRAGQATPSLSNVFLPDPDTAVYEDVQQILDLRALTATTWNLVHPSLASCLLPGDRFDTIFLAQAGVFLEPSIPRTIFDLGTGPAHVVDAGNSLPASGVGMREGSAHGADGAGFPDGAEPVTFSVRRMRRWSTAQNLAEGTLEPLKFAYQIRRGTILSHSIADQLGELAAVTSPDATQLGAFDDPDVNINAGDTLRVLNVDGSLAESITIASVKNASTLTLAPPGLQASFLPGRPFEIYLKQAPVPQEQSNEQLLALMTDQEVFSSSVNYASGDGGHVNAINVLEDTTISGGNSYLSQGIQPGDILIVDPAGELNAGTTQPAPVEAGTRPFGDVGVPGRSGHITGAPTSGLDDNRGFYRITDVNPTDLVVTAAHTYAGGEASNVTFGAGTSEYAVYPTVSAGAGEGQNTLRVTAPSDGSGSFGSGTASVEPFSYKIIRPSNLFSDEAVDLILMHRERILSWLDQLQVFLEGNKRGTYLDFQADEHIANLGDPLLPDTGLGLLSNNTLFGILGQFLASPFLNDRDCLSILDRRFWLLDTRLDGETPPGGGVPYSTFETSGEGRPVLPDRIENILESEDRFRPLRFAWIDYRANRRTGTRLRLENFDSELPRRLKERQRLLLLLENNPSS